MKTVCKFWLALVFSTNSRPSWMTPPSLTKLKDNLLASWAWNWGGEHATVSLPCSSCCLFVPHPYLLPSRHKSVLGMCAPFFPSPTPLPITEFSLWFPVWSLTLFFKEVACLFSKVSSCHEAFNLQTRFSCSRIVIMYSTLRILTRKIRGSSAFIHLCQR